MDELITRLMAMFFEGLEDIGAPAYTMMESERNWWLLSNDVSDEIDLVPQVSELGIYLPADTPAEISDIYDGCRRVDLPEGFFYMRDPDLDCPVGRDIDKYFKNSVKGLQ